MQRISMQNVLLSIFFLKQFLHNYFPMLVLLQAISAGCFKSFDERKSKLGSLLRFSIICNNYIVNVVLVSHYYLLSSAAIKATSGPWALGLCYFLRQT